MCVAVVSYGSPYRNPAASSCVARLPGGRSGRRLARRAPIGASSIVGGLMTRITPSALVLTFTLMLACGGSTSDAGAPADGGVDAGPTIAQACADSAHTRCTKIQSCSAIRIAQLYGDEASCEARVKTTCVANLSAPGNANNPAANEACVAAEDGWACGEFLTGENPPAACTQKLGPLATGAACSAFGQCQSGFCQYSTSACGACQPAPTSGQPCSPTHQCGPGLACSGSKTCIAAAAADAACGTSQPCGPGLMCISAVCKAIDSTVAAGQPCGNVGGKTVACTSGTCEKAVCVGYAADGAPCDDTAGPFCTPGAFCIAGTCRLPACP